VSLTLNQFGFCLSVWILRQRLNMVRHLNPLFYLLLIVAGQPFDANATGGFLAGASSSYLRAHQNDAIKWRPWNTQTLAHVKRSEKPVFLSIGFSACHWCHVMARETFSDANVIKTLNRDFVPVLVDQEERPDIYRHYEVVMRTMTGTSGAPANFILAPDLTPIFAAGFLPPNRDRGLPGLANILRKFTRDWSANADALLANASSFYADMLKQPSPANTSDFQDPAKAATAAWTEAFDRQYGGFGHAPKFPSTNVLSFLLRQASWRGDRELMQMVFLNLDSMAAGGLRDHVGGAFHRYSIDRYWQVPHFEIMLNENALLAKLYVDAWRAAPDGARKERYNLIARGILDALADRLRLANGAFATSLDSMTNGVEGAYYTWSAEEIRTLLPAPEADAFIAAFLDSRHGLVAGRSVLRHLSGTDNLSKSLKRHGRNFQLLAQARNLRVSPKRDEKIITSWNAIAISAYAHAAQAFADVRYLDIARSIWSGLNFSDLASNPLVHSRLNQATSGIVFLEDFAFLSDAMLDLYEADFQIKWLDRARQLIVMMIEMYQPAPGSLFQSTAVEASTGLPTYVPLAENTTPSSNAMAMSAILRLSLFAPDAGFAGSGQKILQQLNGPLLNAAPFTAGMLNVLAYDPDQAHEIVIIGSPKHPETRILLAEIRKRLVRGSVVALIPPGPASLKRKKWSLLAERPQIDNLPTAYVCKKKICNWPVNTKAALVEQLQPLIAMQ